MHRKGVGHAWELAHKSMHYDLTVYGEAVHEEVARKGGFRMAHGGVYHYYLENYVFWCTTVGFSSPVHPFY